ncbi:hypothetical protein KAFR_0A00580 [Kazachstania africana CBS 2517]|uniref:Stationary phase protein 4 n=1 Tax=Kazachstania africana (strain ATCC 22294 / BCRC 22015 / CBS 2517 / CECT 1963 / NBRC 1671 / NRRL Y-8276) TaxID=1071382 RepID=H2AM96_KAZAF|nr:hypothetical protein KAFR_0A00580 [Kazachstania africana CBS 2517]CCF55496.1 hypothetical protein KAFR_0A00580 [Kazachstania africana CBS 2517]
MSNFWNAFEVYNRSKHTKDPEMWGMNHANIGTGNTQYYYSQEYRAPKKKTTRSASFSSISSSTTDEDSLRRSSISETELPKLSKEQQQKEVSSSAALHPKMIDISNLSQREFQDLYQNMRKGEPNNRVNF